MAAVKFVEVKRNLVTSERMNVGCKVSKTDPPGKMQMRRYVWWDAGSVSMARMKRFRLTEID